MARTDEDVAYYLQGLNYPATKTTVMSYAKTKGAGPGVLGDLDTLPDTTYESVAEVIKAVGGAESGGMPA